RLFHAGPKRGRPRRLLGAEPRRRRQLPRRLRPDRREADVDAVRRTGATVAALPPRPLRRVQSGVGPRHALRPAIEGPHREHPDVDAAARVLEVRPQAGSRLARGEAAALPQATGLVRFESYLLTTRLRVWAAPNASSTQ